MCSLLRRGKFEGSWHKCKCLCVEFAHGKTIRSTSQILSGPVLIQWGPLKGSTSVHTSPLDLDSTAMTSEHRPYLAVLKALYDYEPTSEDEVAIKEGQVLFLIEKTDDEYVYLMVVSLNSS